MSNSSWLIKSNLKSGQEKRMKKTPLFSHLTQKYKEKRKRNRKIRGEKKEKEGKGRLLGMMLQHAVLCVLWFQTSS